MTPVTLLTGFLGSGKTTLLARLLKDPALAGAAVLINEFGEIGLDHHLVDRIDDTVVLLRSGCMCCTIRGELADAIRDLHARRERGDVPDFDRLVVETSGLADPFPILTTLKADPVLRHHFKAGTVVTTVDAVNGLRQIETHPESVRQAAVADRLVITKRDLAGREAVEALVARLRQLNPAAVICYSDDALVAEDLVSGNGQVSAKVWFGETFRSDDPEVAVAGDGHLGRIRSFVVTLDEAIDWTAFGIWLSMLLNRHGDKVLRVKGILAIAGEELPVAIHGVQHLVHVPVHLEGWPTKDRRSRIVFIVDGLEPELIRRSLLAFNGLGGG